MKLLFFIFIHHQSMAAPNTLQQVSALKLVKFGVLSLVWFIMQFKETGILNLYGAATTRVAGRTRDLSHVLVGFICPTGCCVWNKVKSLIHATP